MKDNVSDFNINEEIKLPKMHGHTSITLKNVKTGLVEKVESDNVFQPTALEHFLKQGTSLAKTTPYAAPSSSSTDIVYNLFYNGSSSPFEYSIWRFSVGGLFLFQNAIPEGKEYMPAGNRMVGCGCRGYSYNGDVTEMGSFNSTDSEASLNDGMIKQVWDFTTTQANGTIGCVSLTSTLGARLGYGNASGKYIPNFASLYRAFDIVPELRDQRSEFLFGNIGYVFDLKDDHTFRVRKYKTGNTQLSIFNSRLIETLTFDFDIIGKGNMRFSNNNDRFKSYSFRYVGNGIFRFASNSTGSITVANGAENYYYEYNIADDSLTLKSFTNETGENLAVNYEQYTFLRGNKMFVYSAVNSHKTFLINLTNNEVIKVFTNIDEGVNDSYIRPLSHTGNIAGDENLICFCTYNNSYDRIYDLINDTVYITNDADNGDWDVKQKEWDENLYGYYGNHGYYNTYNNKKILKEPRYLATINNLQTPIEKTDAHTMKVTYTLEEV